LLMIPSSLGNEGYSQKKQWWNILFNGGWGLDIGLPYDLCWFDCFLPYFRQNRCGFLLELLRPPIFQIFQFAKHREQALWVHDGLAWLVSPNKPLFEIDNNIFGIQKGGESATVWPKPILQNHWRELFPNMNGIIILNSLLIVLNCKNIVLKKEHPDRKLNLARAKKGKPPLFAYHTLHVKVPTMRTEADGEDADSGRTQRVHLCRGHFKTYTEDKPLFGKYTGRYWWPWMVRGDKKKGLVIKDYNIEAGELP